MRTVRVPDGTNMTRWSVMLAVVMIAMLAMPMEARADGFSWDAGTKTLTVTGTDIANNPAWPIVIGGTSVEKTDVEHLVIGSGVTSIGDGAFKKCTNLKTASLSNDVRSMGSSAFYGCTSLTTINFPQNEDFTRIQNSAFYDCTSLTTITLPNNVDIIGDYAFCGCSGLTSVDLGGVKEIGKQAFYGCSSLPTISLPTTLYLEKIGNNAFASCSSLQTVRTYYFNENNFGNRVFSSSMKGVIIPSLITNITKAEVLATFPSVEYKGHVFYEGTKSKCEQAFHETFSFVDKYYRTYFVVGGTSYIHWLCTATFDTQGMAPNPAPVTNVWAGWDEVKCGSEPTTTGYDFDGWYRDEECTILFGTTKEVDGQTVTTYSGVIPGDVTLYAKWKPNIYYTVSFDTGGKCNPPRHQDIPLNKTAKEPNVLYYYNKDDGKDYCIEGWYTDKGCTQRYDFNTPVDHSFTLYAKWALATKRQAFVSLTYAGEGCYATLIDANGQEFWNFESGYVPPGLYTINIISGKDYDESNYTGSIVYVPRPDQNGQSQSGESQEGQSQSGESQEGQSQAEDSQAGESQTGTSTGGEGNDPSEGGSTEAVPTVTNFKYNGMRSIDLNLDLTSHDAYITINCICINPDIGGIASPPEGGHVTFAKGGRTTGGIYKITFTPNEGYVFVRCNLSKTTGTGSGALTPASATSIGYAPTSGPQTVTYTAPYTDSDHSITYGFHFDPVFEKSSVAPFITTQPLGVDLPQGYTSGHVLTVAARTEEGQLSYQWYQNTKNSYSGTAIDGATEPSYAIPAGLPAGTTFFYYCKVTATSGEKSVYANSHIVAVNVGTAATRAFTTPDAALPAAGGTASAGIATGTRGEGDTPPAELSGKYHYGLDWAVSKSAGSDEYDVLTISGSGAAMRSVSQSEYPWYGYRGTIKSIVVGDGVPNIGNEAFKDFTGVTSLVLGKDVMIIGNEAFAGLTSLASLAIGESVKIIGKSAFKDCTSLVSLDLGDVVTSIGNSAFYGCTSLESLVIGDEVALIGRYAFGGCTKLGSIVVGEKNATFDSRGECNAVIRKEINDNNVSDDTKGELVLGCKNTVIPNTVTSIGDFAFARCGAPTTLDIPNSVTTIGEYAFEKCTSLTSVTIPASVTCIYWHAFFGCTGVTDVYCYADYRKLVWYDENCNDFKAVSEYDNMIVCSKTTKCHVFAKAPFDTAWGKGDGETDINVTFVGDLATNGPTRTITVSADPADGGTVTGGTSGTYALGTQFEFKATPNEGYRFVNWTIDGINGGSETTYPFVVNGDFSTVVAHFERIYPLSGDYVGFYDKDSNPITVAAEGETVTVSYNPYDPEDDNKVIIPSGKYFTGNYTSADGVTFTPIEGNTDVTFIMPAKAVTVSAELAEQEEYTLDLTTDEPQEIPESMWQLLYRNLEDNSIFDTETGEWFLDLNLDGSRDVLLEEDYDETAGVSTYRATRLAGADAIKTDLRFDLTYDIPLQYNSVLFNLVVDVVDLVRAIGEGKTQAEIDAIVNAIMQKK